MQKTTNNENKIQPFIAINLHKASLLLEALEAISKPKDVVAQELVRELTQIKSFLTKSQSKIESARREADDEANVKAEEIVRKTLGEKYAVNNPTQKKPRLITGPIAQKAIGRKKKGS